MQRNTFLLPFTVATVFVLLILLALINSGMPESNKIIVISLCIWLVWFILFYKNRTKTKEISTANTRLKNICVVALCVIIALFYANTIWSGDGMFSLNPITDIVNGNIWGDNFGISGWIESIKTYGNPFGADFKYGIFGYHYGSYYLSAALSILFRVSGFYFHQYLLPLIFVPLYVFLIISVIIAVRKYKKITPVLSIVDYVFLAFFCIGFLPTSWINSIGIYKRYLVVSDSYLVAQIFFLSYVRIFLKLLDSNKPGKKNKQILLFVINILFIFICSAMKISIGFLLFVGIGYYIFRKYTRNIKYWALNVLYLAVFLVAYMIFGLKITDGSTGMTAPFIFFHFVRSYTSLGSVGYVWHYVILLLLTLAFLYYRLSKSKTILRDLYSKTFLYEETLIVVTIASQLPGILLSIQYASAVFFINFQELLGIISLIGFNVINDMKSNIQKEKPLRNICRFFGILFISTIVFNSGLGNCFVKVASSRIKSSKCYIENAPSVSIKENIKEYFSQGKIIPLVNHGFRSLFDKNVYLDETIITNVNKLTAIPISERNQYGIFLDSNAEIFSIFEPESHYQEAIYILFYRCFTSMVVLNEDNGSYVSSSTIEESLEKAKFRNLKYLIHVYDDTYRIIDIAD